MNFPYYRLTSKNLNSDYTSFKSTKMIFDFLATERQSNSVECTWKLMQLLRVYENRQKLSRKFNSHPNNGTLLSISDILKEYGIQNKCIKIDKSRINSVSMPSVVALRIDQTSYFTTIEKCNEDCILVHHPVLQRNYSYSREEFDELWSGIILLVESSISNNKTSYTLNQINEKIKFWLIRLILVILPLITLSNILTGNTNPEIPAWGLILLFISYLLGTLICFNLINSIDKNDTFIISKLCKINEGFDCNSILESSASNIAGIPLSIIGFTYFLSGAIILTFFDLRNLQTILTLKFLNFLSLPFILFSLYYQWIVIKKWCLFCLFVQFLLLAEILINSYCFRANWRIELDRHQTYQIGFVYIAIFVGTLYYYSFQEKKVENRNLENSLTRFKYDKEVFQTILEKQERIPADINPDLGIVLGNLKGNTEIIKICNPYCKPCIESHAALEQLLISNNEIRIRIIYNITDNIEDLRSLPIKHLFSIWKETPELLRKALNDWYSSKSLNYDDFALNYPIKNAIELQEFEVKKMYTWCVNNALDDRSPLYIVNGYFLPEVYTIGDLKSIL